VALVVGFGGLLALLAAAGIISVRALEQIQAANMQIHRDYQARERTLDQIRSSLSLSGNVVRDYLLLDPGQSVAETLRDELKRIRHEMDAALKAYARSLRPEEKDAFQHLSSEVETYWAVLNPIFEWDAKEKRELAYWFVRRELFPRRTAVLNLAREIAVVNEQTLQEGEKQVAGVFARFRGRLQLITWVAVGLGLLLAGVSILYILRLERSADERYQESVRAREELKELSARLVDVQEQERRAISRELHDEVGQSLSALLVDLGNLAAIAPADGGPFRQHLDSIKKLAESSVKAVRNMALLLRPSMLDDLGLVPALQWQAREVAKRTGMRVDLVEENVGDDLPEAHRTCVYRVVQEALHNCGHHAEAHSVRIVVRQEAGRLLLTIQDDGKGFDTRQVRGLGLVGMTERVAHLGGSFQVLSERGRGTLLRIDLPLASGAVVPATQTS
jgi:signal transduction histidine kinase